MKVIELNDLVFAIESRQDLVNFIEALREDLAPRAESWENVSLENYLDALAAWLHGPDEVYTRFGKAVPLEASW